MAAQARGIGAEGRVCQTLEKQGWTVLLRRARTPYGEIDIVALDPAAALIAFIEVKARRVLCEAAHALSARQRKRLIGAAAILIDRHPQWSDYDFRFDLILMDDTGSLRRVANAFRIGDA
jgi:putative endonuclease